MLLGLTLAAAGISFIVAVVPEFSETFFTAFSNVRNHSYRSCVDTLSKFKDTSENIYTNYKKDWINLQTLTDFIMFKIRLYASQNLETGLLKSVGKKYELTYYNGDMKYKILFPKNRGPRQICQVETEAGEDITSEILILMGPGHNFHGIPSTPKLLGWEESLKVRYRTGEEIYYESLDVISLYPQ